MRVIEKGPPPETWVKRVVCTGQGNGDLGCGALLEITRGDLFITHSFDGESEDLFITFRCCLCCNLTDIASTQDVYVPAKFLGLPTQTEWDTAHGILGPSLLDMLT